MTEAVDLKKNPSVLVVSDTPDMAGKIIRPLSTGLSCHVRPVNGNKTLVSTEKFPVVLIHTENPDVILSQMYRFRGKPLYLVCTSKDPDLILQGFRLGLSDVFVLPEDNARLERKIKGDLKDNETPDVSSTRPCRVISLFSPRGGQGVTSLAVNLCRQWGGDERNRVLLLDLNLYRGDVSTLLNQPSDYTVFDLHRDLDRLDRQLFLSQAGKTPYGFHVIGTPDHIGDPDALPPDDMPKLINVLRPVLTHLVVDLPHDYSGRTRQVLSLSDNILLPFCPDLPGIKSVRACLDFFEEALDGHAPIKLVLNKMSRRMPLDVGDISVMMEKPVMAALPFAPLLFEEALERCMPLPETSRSKGLYRAFHAIARSIDPEGTPRAASEGWLSRFRAMGKGGNS